MLHKCNVYYIVLDIIDRKTKTFKNHESNKSCLSCMSCVKRCPMGAKDYTIPKIVEVLLDKIYFKRSQMERKEPFLLNKL